MIYRTKFCTCFEKKRFRNAMQKDVMIPNAFVIIKYIVINKNVYYTHKYVCALISIFQLKSYIIYLYMTLVSC